jgi:hypothetical protein
MYPTTVAKIESGERAVRIDEATAIADLFEVSVDTLLGRNVERGSDLGYTIRSVQNIACQSAQQSAAIADALAGSLVDLDALEFKGRAPLEREIVRAQRALGEAQTALSKVAKFQPPPGSTLALRKDLVIREARTVVISPGGEDVKVSDDEAQS